MNASFLTNDKKDLYSRLLTLLYPRRCPVCDRVVPFGKLVHRKCLGYIKPVGAVTCMKCGKPLRDAGQEYCSDCKTTPHCFDRGFSVFRYRSVSGSLYRFKYAGRREYADFYARAACLLLGDTIRSLDPDALVPVPLHPSRERKRGYNQSAVFAEALGKLLGIPVNKTLVRRVQNTVPMKGLSSPERRNNLKNAFQSGTCGVKSECVVIVDDIYTTGSTVDAVARVLRGDGVKRIYCLTLAIGETA